MLLIVAKLLSGRSMLIGVDRLDYSKGIGLRVQAFDRFLADLKQQAMAEGVSQGALAEAVRLGELVVHTGQGAVHRPIPASYSRAPKCVSFVSLS